MTITTNPTRINREELARKLVAKGIVDTKIAGTVLLDCFFDVLKEEILAGNTIAIPDFGKFEKSQLQNGKYKVKFSAFEAFKLAVNQ